MNRPKKPHLTLARRRAQQAARRIPNAPHPDRAQRIHIWAEFVKQVLNEKEFT